MKIYDIVLFGATGFTGKLIAKYLAENGSQENIHWAIAGRDFEKLQTLQSNLVGLKPEIVVADVKNYESLSIMANSTHVLMNTVGPFNWYGYDVVKACVENHTHYLDITGEPLFVNKIYDLYKDKAQENQCTIVNCCGFDSIPAEFATWMTVRKMNANDPKTVQTFIRTNASFSGGTLTTAINALYEQSKGNTSGSRYKKHPNAPKHALKLHFSKLINGWAIPMPVVDPHIVKRSAATLSDDYGPFAYGQYFVRSSFWKVLGTIFPIGMAALLVRFEWFRKRMYKKYHSGSGPTEEKRNSSKFEVKAIGISQNEKVETVFSGGDPGYNETAKMFSEAAFCIVEKSRNHQMEYGVLTPVQAFGLPLVERLRNKGIRIE
jgi:short subunit dehydrogenase-like uncharacterized protein